MTFELTPEERNHPLWKKLVAYQQGRLDELRARNDAPCDHDKTTFRRGEIRAIKVFLALDKGPAPVISEDD